MDPPRTTEDGALAGDVGQHRPAGVDEPCGEGGVEASGDGILRRRAVLREERPNLERLMAPRRVRTDDPDVHVHGPGAHGEDRIRIGEEDGDPVGAVGRPLGVDDREPVDSELRGDPRQRRLVDRPRVEQWRCPERQTIDRPPDGNQPGPALLDDPPGIAGTTTGLEPGVARPERRVTGERQLARGVEDSDAVVRGGIGRREDEGGLGQVRPARKVLHRCERQALRLEHHRERVAEKRARPEDVHLPEPAPHAGEYHTAPAARRMMSRDRDESPATIDSPPSVLALTRGAPGVYNIVDDGGPVSNARARRELGREPG